MPRGSALGVGVVIVVVLAALSSLAMVGFQMEHYNEEKWLGTEAAPNTLTYVNSQELPPRVVHDLDSTISPQRRQEPSLVAISGPPKEAQTVLVQPPSIESAYAIDYFFVDDSDGAEATATPELVTWLAERGLSSLRPSLESLGAYRPQDLGLLDENDRRRLWLEVGNQQSRNHFTL